MRLKTNWWKYDKYSNFFIILFCLKSFSDVLEYIEAYLSIVIKIKEELDDILNFILPKSLLKESS